MVVTETTKIGNAKNCLIIPKYDYRQLGGRKTRSGYKRK